MHKQSHQNNLNSDLDNATSGKYCYICNTAILLTVNSYPLVIGEMQSSEDVTGENEEEAAKDRIVSGVH